MSILPQSASKIEDDHRLRERLLPAVYDLALRLGADPHQIRATVRLAQSGRLRQIGAAHWMAFRARQTISTLRCQFDWRARAGFAGLITARDVLTEEGGRFDVRAFGLIPIVRAERSSALLRGELMRYLAELAWAPDAILHNAELRWREDGPDKLAESAGSGETAAEVVLSLDGQGRIAGGFAPDRPVRPKCPFSQRRGEVVSPTIAIWLPFAGEVAWMIDGKEDVYWPGRVENWETIADGRR